MMLASADVTSFAEILARLRAEYVAATPGRLAQLDLLIRAMESGEPSARAELDALLHRLIGTAGAHGLAAIVAAARILSERIAVERVKPLGLSAWPEVTQLRRALVASQAQE